MKKMVPAPEFLAIRVKVVFPRLPAQNQENIQIEQFDNCSGLLKQLDKLFESKGNPVVFK